MANAQLLQRFQRLSRACGAIVVAVGALVFLGWALNHPLLNRLVAGRFIMQLNTGAAFVLSGVALLLPPSRRWLALACGVVVALIGVGVLAEYVFGVQTRPGRMEPETAANFVLVGLALSLRPLGRPRGFRLAQAFALVTLFSSLMALFGHAFAAKVNYGITQYTQMTFGTLTTFLLTVLGILFADPDRGLMSMVSSDTPGGAMARRLYPAAIGIPLVLGWLTLMGERTWLYNGKFGLSLMVITSIIVFVVMISLTYRSIDRMDAQRMRLAAILLEEAERRHIARELHDEVGQSLTALKFQLEAVGRGSAEDGAARVRDARGLVDELMARVSNLSLDLRPAMLDDLGLLPALVWLFERYTTQTGISVDFQRAGLGERFAAEVETAAFRVVQEALTNVARHAGVTQVTVRAWVNDGTVGVQVADGGKGFAPDEEMQRADSGGLIGMRERALALGGTLTIDSRPGQGVQVTAEFPLKAAMQARA
jgi:signal transduction histidine kinase